MNLQIKGTVNSVIVVMASSRKRVELSLSQKVEVLKFMESSGISQARAARKFGVSRSQVSRLMLSKDRILRDHEKGNRNRKRKRLGKYSEIEEALLIWYQEKVSQGVRLSGPLLKEKAKALGLSHGFEFKPSDGWLDRWKVRHNIAFKKTRCEKQDTDMAAVKERRAEGTSEILLHYHPDEISSAGDGHCEEVKHGLKETELPGGKKASSGTKETSKPRSFPRDLCTLPVMYDPSRNGWMTGDIFKKWLLDWDADLRAQNRQVCLVVDNSAAHIKDDELSNITMTFLPRTTSIVPPMDMEVIKNWTIARRAPTDDQFETKCARDVARPVPRILDALHLATRSSDSVRPSTAANTYQKAGFNARNGSYGKDELDDSIADSPDTEYIKIEYLQVVDDDAAMSDGESSSAELRVEGSACSTQHSNTLNEFDHHGFDSDMEDDSPLTSKEKVSMVDLLGRFVIQNDLDQDNLSYNQIETLVFSQVSTAKK